MRGPERVTIALLFCLGAHYATAQQLFSRGKSLDTRLPHGLALVAHLYNGQDVAGTCTTEELESTCTTSQVSYETQSYVTYYSQTHSDSYGCGWWGRRCTRTLYSQASRTSYRSVEVYYTTCCSGYGGSQCSAICSPSCENGGVCSSPNNCICPEGWSGDICTEDVCECCLGTHMCDNHATCFNLAGSYTCSCNNGFQGDGFFCEDVDECTTENGGCHQNCHNTVGSYYCSCDHPYSLAMDSVTCSVPPPPPTNVTVSAVGTRTATLSWQAPSVDFPNDLTAISQYLIQANPYYFDIDEVSVLIDANTFGYTFPNNLEEFVTYTVTIQAINSFGVGEASTDLQLHTLQAEPSVPPPSFTVTPTGPYGLRATWSPLSHVDLNGFLIYYVLHIETAESGSVTVYYPLEEEYNINGLHPFHNYYCQIAAYTIDIGPYSSSYAVQTLPAAPTAPPTAISIESYNSTSITISWLAPPLEDQNGDIARYHIMVYEHENEYQFNVTSSTNNITLYSLHPYFTYSINLAAETVAIGPFSANLTLQLPEAAPSAGPQNVSAVALSSTSVLVTWNVLSYDSQNGMIRSYITSVLERETQTSNEHESNTLEITLSHLHPYYTYECQVAAVTIEQGPFSAPVVVQTLQSAPSSAPVNLSVEILSSRSLLIYWLPPAFEDQNGLIVGYAVDVKSHNNTHVYSGNVDGNNVVLNSSFIKPYSEYNVAVAAYTEVDLGLFSSVVQVFTPEDVPTNPHIVSLTRVHGQPHNLLVTWDPPAETNGIILSYTVYCSEFMHGSGSGSGSETMLLPEYSAEGSSSWPESSGVELDSESGSANHLESYVIVPQVIVSGNETELLLEGFIPYTEYLCYVTANTSVGESTKSDSLSAVTEESVPGDSPKGFSSTVHNSSSIHLTWSEPSLPYGIILHYTIEYNKSHNSTVTVRVEAQSRSYLIDDLNEYTVYSFSIYASTRVGDGPRATTTATTYESSPSSPPREVGVIHVGRRSAHAVWQPPIFEDQNGPIVYYQMWITQNQFSTVSNVTITTSGLSYNLTDLEEYTEYNLFIAAATSTGVGPFSSPVIFTTLEDVPSAPPLNVTAVTLSSTVIEFFWQPPHAQDLNGVLRNYNVIIEELPTGREWDYTSNGTEFLATSLHPYYNYSCRVSAITFGTGPYSTPVTSTTFEAAPDAPPSRPRVVFFTSTSIALTWQAPPLEHINGIIRRYTVHLREVDTGNDIIVTSYSTNITIYELHPHFIYTFKVRAETISPGPYSAEDSIQLEEDGPNGSVTELVGNASTSTSIHLFWSPPNFLNQNGIIRHYIIQMVENETLTTTDFTTTYTNLSVSNLHPAYTYTFSVSAVTVASGPFSEPITVTTLEAAPYSSVQDIEVNINSSREVYVFWNPPPMEHHNGIIIGYLLNLTTVEELEGELHHSNDSGITLRNLLPHKMYMISIAASTSAGVGPFSEMVTFITPEDAPSSPPVDVVLTAINSRTLSISWSPPPTDQRNGIVREYMVTVTETDTETTVNYTSNSASLILSSLHPFYTYVLTLAAYTVQYGPSSAPFNITMPGDIPSSAPTSVRVVNVTSTTLSLQWNPLPAEDHNGIITGYVVNYTRVNTGFTDTIFSSTTSVDIGMLMPYTTYSFFVAAETQVGSGPFSPSLQHTTEEDAPSSAPTNLVAEASDPFSLLLTWNTLPEGHRNGVIRHYIVNILETATMITSQQMSYTTSATIYPLHPYYIYNLSVAAYTVAMGPFSVPVSLQLPPSVPSGPPLNIEAGATSSVSAFLSWDPPVVEDQNGVITNYTLSVYVENEEEFVLTTPNTAVNVSSLQPHTCYELFVFASTIVGHGPSAHPIDLCTPEDAPTHGPTNLTVVDIGPYHIHLNWSHPPEDTHQGIIREYHVYTTELETGRALFNTTTANNTEIYLDNLHPYYLYHIAVGAFTVDAGNYSSITIRTVETVPSAAPQEFSVNITSSRSVELAWIPPLEYEQNGFIEGYIINISREADALDQMMSIMTFLVISNLSPYTNYSFSVAAVTVGVGPFSPVVTVTMPEYAPFGPPQNVSAEPVSSRVLLIMWSPPERHVQNGVIRRYIINITEIDTSNTWAVESTEVERALTLHPFYRYVLVIAAVTVDVGPYSMQLIIQMPEDVPTAPPENITVENVLSDTVILSWEHPPVEQQNGEIQSYVIEVTEVDSGREYNITSLETEYAVGSLHPYYTYSFRIAAVSVGAGPFSQPTNTTTLEAVPSGEPTHLNVAVFNSTSIQVMWRPPLEIHQNGVITNYSINISSLASGHTNTLSVSSLTHNLVFHQLQPYTTYGFAVAAENSAGVGPYTSFIHARTSEDAPAAPPQDIAVHNITSTSFTLTWQPPPLELQNGVIRSYTITIAEVETENTFVLESLSTSILVGSLHPYYTYVVSIRAVTILPGPYSDMLELITLPEAPSAPPSNTTVDIQSSVEILLSWSPPRNEDRNGEIEYYIVSMTETTTLYEYEIEALSTSLNISNLHPFYTYQISVAAVTVDTGPFSPTVTFTMPEDAPSGPPQNFTGEAVNSTAISLSWEPPVLSEQNGVIDFYNITIANTITSTQASFEVPSEHTQRVITSLHPYYIYEFRVAAGTVSLGIYSSSLAIRTLPDVPSRAPSNTVVVVLNSTALSVSWQPLDPQFHNGILQYYTLRVVELVTSSVIEVNENLTYTVISSLHPYYEYNLTVAAVTTVGTGPFSNPLTATTAEDIPSGPPTGVNGETVNSSSIIVSWHTVQFEQRNGIITGYQIVVTAADGGVSWQQNVTATTINVHNLEPYSTYSVSIAAINVAGIGPSSIPIEIVTDESAPSSAPSGLRATDVGQRNITIEWSPPPIEDWNGVIRLYILKAVECETGAIVMLNLTITEQLLGNLHPYYTYNISVAAVTLDTGPFSLPISVTTLQAAPSGAPRSVAADEVTSTSIALSWEPPPTNEHNGVIESYAIIMVVQETGARMEVQINATHYVFSFLHPYYTYSISIAALTVDTGPFSDPYTVRTLEQAPSGPPQNVSALVLSATHLLLNWEPPPNEEQNGVIQYYVVTINQLESNISYTYHTEDFQYTVQDLHPYYVYECIVAAMTVDLGPPSPQVTVRMFQDAPSSPPLGISIVILSTRSVNISWTPPPPTEHNGIIQYYLLKQQNFNSGEMQIYSIHNSLAITVDNLHPFYSYSFSLAAVTIEIGPYSMETIITMPQDLPTGEPLDLEGTSLSSTHLELRWLPPPPADQNGVITAYHINITELNTGTVFTFAVSGTTLFFSSLAFHAYYEYSCLISAVTVGVGPAAHTEVTTREDVPTAAPQNVTVVVLSSTSAQLSWEPPPPDQQNGVIRKYEVIMVVLSLPLWAEHNVSDLLFYMDDLHPYTNYLLVVAATTISTGPFSDPVHLDMPEAPPGRGVQNFTVSVQSASSVIVAWLPPHPTTWNGILTNYTVFYELLGSVIPLTSNESTSGGGSQQVISLQLELFNNYPDPHAAVLPLKKEMVVIDNLHEFHVYGFNVIMENSAGQSDISTTIIQELPGAEPSGAPKNIQIQVLSSTSVEVLWESPDFLDQNGVIITYWISVIDVTLNTEIIFNTTVDNKFIVIEDLQKYTEYTVGVTAATEHGRGPSSNILHFKTLQDVPSHPTNVTIVRVGDRTILVSWMTPLEPNGLITQYELMYAGYLVLNTSDRNEANGTILQDGPETLQTEPFTSSLALNNLTQGLSYVIKVRASTSVGFGEYSSPEVILIPQVSKESENNDTKPETVDNGSNSGEVVVTILAIIGWGITLVIVVLILVKCFRRKKKGKYQPPTGANNARMLNAYEPVVTLETSLVTANPLAQESEDDKGSEMASSKDAEQ